MANTKFFQGLPNFDTQSIANSDEEILAKVSELLEAFNWHEKMAVGQTAYFFIDNTHHKLLKLTPIHGELNEPVLKAMRLVEGLSPQALAKLAEDILQEDFEGEIEVKHEN